MCCMQELYFFLMKIVYYAGGRIGMKVQSVQNDSVHKNRILNVIFCLFLQGDNPKKPGTPNNVRLYSIASTRYGDSFNGKTATLCVRRAVYYDPETGKEDPSKNGICSNFLCDSKPGDKVQIAGTFSLIPVHFVCWFV